MTTRASTSTAVARREGLDLVKHELELRHADLRQVLPEGMSVERFMRVSILAVSKNPELLKCTPTSIITSIIDAAEIGIEPTGALNRAWLVPFKEDGVPKAQLMIGYQGYADLMRDSGKIGQIWAEAVFKDDLFKVVKGSNPRIEHEPAYTSENPADVTFVYAVVVFRDGTQHFEVMTRQQVEVIRARSKQKNGPTWRDNWVQMARKTVVRRVANYVPLSERAITGFAKDDEREYGPGVATATVSRTSEVRSAISDRIAARGKPAEEPDAGEKAGDPASGKSAGQQTDAAGDTTDGLCGATSDPALGGVESCALPAGHESPDGKPSPHRSEAATTWPNGGVK